jgi:hypothetical protein
MSDHFDRYMKPVHSSADGLRDTWQGARGLAFRLERLKASAGWRRPCIAAVDAEISCCSDIFIYLLSSAFLYIHPWTVSNTDNVNILCKYLMYILTDYRLILTKDTKDRPHLSSERGDPSGTGLARTSSNSKLQIRPLAREGATK